MEKAEALALLAEIARTPAGQVSANDKICQSVKRTVGEGWSSEEIKIPGKIEAINTLAKMCGWATPEKHDVKFQCQEEKELIEVIARIRGRGAARNNQCAG